MKKAITLLLAAVMALSLAACGGNDGNTTTPSGGDSTPTAAATQEETTTPSETQTIEPEQQILKIGETATTPEFWEFTLVDVGLSRYIDEVIASNGFINRNFLMPTDNPPRANSPFMPDDGYGFITISYYINYLGKTPLDFQISGTMELDYNDGFTFPNDMDVSSHRLRLEDTWEIVHNDFQIRPLSQAQEYRTTIKIPLEVIENTNAPLLLHVYSPNEFDGVIQYIYDYMSDNNEKGFTTATYDLRAEGVIAEPLTISDTIDRELQGTWISPNGDMTWIFDNGTLQYDQVRVNTDEPNDTGTVRYRVTENAVIFRYPNINRDAEISLKFENGVLTLFGEDSVSNGGGQYEYIKQ